MSRPNPHHRHHQRREDRQGRAPQQRGLEQWEGGHHQGDEGVRQRGYGEPLQSYQPQRVNPTSSHGQHLAVDPICQQQRPVDIPITVSGFGYQQHNQGNVRYSQPHGGYELQRQDIDVVSGYPQQAGYQPQHQGGIGGLGYQQPQGGYQQPQGGYQQPLGGYQQPQGGYQQPQGGYQQPLGGYQQPQGGYQQPQDRYQQPQVGYQPQDQERVLTSSFQQRQAPDIPTGLGHQEQQHENPPQNADGPTGEFPPLAQNGSDNLGYSHGEMGVSGMRVSNPRQYGSECNPERVENTKGESRESYGEHSQKAKRTSNFGAFMSRVTTKYLQQNRHSSPVVQDDEVKNPISRRRVLSDKENHLLKLGKVQIANPMGMRLRRCLPELDFKEFAKNLDEEELKTFLPHLVHIPEPDYSSDEEEVDESEVPGRWAEDREERADVEEKREEIVEERGDHEEMKEGEPKERDEGRKESDVQLGWAKNERIGEKGTREIIIIDKLRPQSMKKEFAKEVVDDKMDEITESSKKLTSYELFKLETSRKWKNTKVQLWEMLQMLVVWRGSFKEIEGQYGSSTTSYFSVLRWLMFLNLFVTIVIFGAVVLPQLFFQPATFPKTLDTTTNLTSFQKTAMTCSIIYKNLMDNVTKQQGIADQVLAVVQGTGWMERTVLFAGFYFNKTYQLGEEVKLGGEEERSYNMPLAFLFATAAYFSITLILMILYTGDGMKEQLLSAGEQHNYYFNKIFSAWDCTLMQEKAASQKMLDLLRAFKNDLEQIKEKTRRAKMSTLERAQVYAKRICVNVIVLAFWAGAGYLIYMVVTVWSKQLLEKKIVQTSEVLKLIIDFLPSLTITILNVFIPTLFYMLVKVEDLSPDAEVEFTVARSVVLRLASIIVLVVSLQTKISKCRSEEEDVGSLGCHNCEETRCWETYVGGQFYKLVVMDFFVTLITTIVEFLRRIVAKNLGTETLLGKLVGLNEFDLPKNVLDIVYSQTICWIGAFFCPLIPAITVVKFFLYFYMKKITLLKNYVQSQKAYRASKSNTFFMAILLASFVLCAIVMAYVIGRVQPSVSCGPWRVYSKEEYFMYVSVSDVVSTAPYLWRTILTFLTSSLFYIPMLIFMSLVIYYNVAIASGNKRIIAILKDQLAMEGKDKQFLLQEVRKAMKSGKLAQ